MYWLRISAEGAEEAMLQKVLKMILKVWEQMMQKKLKADWPCISGLCM